MFRKKLILFILILLLNSCAGLSEVKSPSPTNLIRPNLESLEQNDRGGICMDKEDTAELLIYIDRLESAVAE